MAEKKTGVKPQKNVGALREQPAPARRSSSSPERSSSSPERSPSPERSSSRARAVVSGKSSLKTVTIFCDGSSLGNGQALTRAAAVALLGYRGVWRAVGSYLGTATNQQAEIAAAALGLEALREPCRVHLTTDSRYVVETMCGRFRRKSNPEWWTRLDKAVSRHQVTWEWAKGHAGHVIQEACDKAARRIAALGHADESVLREAAENLGVREISIDPE